MKIIDYRDPKGRYARKNRQKGNVKIVVLLIVLAIIGILYFKAKGQNIEPWQLIAKNESAQKIESSPELTAEQEANLKKQYELAKQETVLMNKKTKLDADYKAESASIESQLESIREQQTSFK
jgi:hypothetical protein